MPEQVAVLLDYQNVHLVGHDMFSRGKLLHECVPEPTLLADRIASRRHTQSEAAEILVYRGRPDHQKQKTVASANDKQAAQWTRRDERVTMIRRQLNYRGWPKSPPVEKGIDVKLAVDLIHRALSGNLDALIVFSSDTDLVPAIELGVELRATIEIVCWDGANPLRCPGATCHYLTAEDWKHVCRDWTGRA